MRSIRSIVSSTVPIKLSIVPMYFRRSHFLNEAATSSTKRLYAAYDLLESMSSKEQRAQKKLRKPPGSPTLYVAIFFFVHIRHSDLILPVRLR